MNSWRGSKCLLRFGTQLLLMPGCGSPEAMQEFPLGEQKIIINKPFSSIWGFATQHLPWGATWGPPFCKCLTPPEDKLSL